MTNESQHSSDPERRVSVPGREFYLFDIPRDSVRAVWARVVNSVSSWQRSDDTRMTSQFTAIPDLW